MSTWLECQLVEVLYSWSRYTVNHTNVFRSFKIHSGNYYTVLCALLGPALLLFSHWNHLLMFNLNGININFKYWLCLLENNPRIHWLLLGFFIRFNSFTVNNLYHAYHVICLMYVAACNVLLLYVAVFLHEVGLQKLIRGVITCWEQHKKIKLIISKTSEWRGPKTPVTGRIKKLNRQAVGDGSVCFSFIKDMFFLIIWDTSAFVLILNQARTIVTSCYHSNKETQTYAVHHQWHYLENGMVIK